METKIKNLNNAVVWFEIYVDDLARAKKFYETALVTQLDEMQDPSNSGIQMASFPMHMDKANASGALVKMEGFKPGGNGTVVYFDSQDCATEEARVLEAGGKVFQGKTSIGGHGSMCLCKDSEGNTFGVHSMK